jgi:hypothetical protein
MISRIDRGPPVDNARVKRPLVFLLLIGMLLTAILEPGYADQGAPRYQPGEILVKFRPGVRTQVVATLTSRHGAQAMWDSPKLGVWRLRVKPGSEQAAIRAWSALPDVLFAEPNYLVRAMADPPDDTYYSRLWNLDKVRGPEAWQITLGDPSVPLAIIDTGVDLDHPDLMSKLWINPDEIPANDLDDDHNGYVDDVHGYDFINEDADPDDDHGHGTHVAGTAAAATDNGLGVAGMAPANPLMALKVLGSGGEGSYADLIEAMSYALTEGAQVMNMSLAGEDESPALEDAVEAASAAGAIVVAAAGNYAASGNPILYPAAYDDSLAVGATDRYDGIASFSEHHPYVDVVAPGSSVYSTLRGGSYGYKSGTSMATPHVAGLAALMWAVQPTLTQAEVVGHITQNAVDLGVPGKDNYYGWGRIDARSSLCEVIPPFSVSPPALTLMTDPYSLTVPSYGAVQVLSGCTPITWTATISSTSDWLHLVPISGTLAQTDSQLLLAHADPTQLGDAYGEYGAQVRLTTTSSSEEDVVDVHLRYVPRIHPLVLPLVRKP